MKLKPFLTTLALLGAVATTASAKTYTCDITPAGNYAWIPEIVVIDHDESTGRVVVLDPYIKHFKDGPIDGKVTTDNNKRTTFKWVLENITVNSRGTPKFVRGFHFSLTVQKASNKASMFSTPIGYTNRDRGEGKCVVE